MIKLILTLIISLTVINADIVFKGDCGSYKYDLNISNNKYYGGQCIKDQLRVYYDSGTDYIRSIYVDPQISTSLDIHHLYNGRVYKSFNYNDGDVIFIGSPNLRFLYGLAGLLLGFLTIQIFFRTVLRR